MSKSPPASVLLPQDHFQALCIAAASSTDNFLVGVVLGTEQHHQYHDGSSSSSPHHALVWGIAASNAVGCYLATATGSAVLQSSAGLQHVVAGAAFAYLGFKEYYYAEEEDGTTSSSSAPGGAEQQQQRQPQHLPPTFWQLALPMTLNNLAGGVASGVAGVSCATASGYAFWTSAIFMYAGLWLGARLLLQRKEKVEEEDAAAQQIHRRMATCVSVALYSVLALQSFYEAIS